VTRALIPIGAALLVGCSGPSNHATGCKLASHVSFQGATGNLLGGYSVTNRASRACRLGGFPRIALYRSDGRRVALTVHRGDPAFPSTRRVMLLRPGRAATAWIKWENYCGSLWNRPFTFRLTLTTGQTVSARTGMAEKCQTNGGAPMRGPGKGELSLSAFRESPD
jgi:hypothetical protein